MSKNLLTVSAILATVAASATFEDFQAWAKARANELIEIENAEESEKAAAIEAAESAAKAHDDAVASFDPSKIDKQAAIEMGLTNGMPEWLIMQKYAAWKLAHPDA